MIEPTGELKKNMKPLRPKKHCVFKEIGPLRLSIGKRNYRVFCLNNFRWFYENRWIKIMQREGRFKLSDGGGGVKLLRNYQFKFKKKEQQRREDDMQIL